MSERIDALAGRKGPWPTRGDLLARQLDGDLQRCVEAAAQETNAPIALVTLVLERTQFFRAHVGLPDALQVAQATDRTCSFCQFVVRDGASFEVSDATADLRVPKDLVHRLGIRAYLGVPVFADGVVAGSLCVIDTVTRSFTDDDRATLTTLGQRASERLQALAEARDPPQQRLVRQAVAPAFEEVRNVLVPLSFASSRLRLLGAELEPLAALLSSELGADALLEGLAAQPSHATSIRDLAHLTDELAVAYGRLESSFNAIAEAVSESATSVSLSALLRTGLKLAFHATKLVGGVELGDCPEDEKVVCTTALGSAVISVGASALASACTAHGALGPIRCQIEFGGTQATVAFSTAAGLAPRLVAGVADELHDLASDVGSISVEARGSSLRISFRRHAR